MEPAHKSERCLYRIVIDARIEMAEWGGGSAVSCYDRRGPYKLAGKVSVFAGKKWFCVEEILFLSSAFTIWLPNQGLEIKFQFIFHDHLARVSVEMLPVDFPSIAFQSVEENIWTKEG
jgi:hypothetical protein